MEVNKFGNQPTINGKPIFVKYQHKYPKTDRIIRALVIQFTGDNKAIIVTENGSLVETELNRISMWDEHDTYESLKVDATGFFANPTDIVVTNIRNNEKFILLGFISIEGKMNVMYFDKNGYFVLSHINDMKVLMTEEQKALLKGQEENNGND